MVVPQQKEKPCVLENQILNEEKHLEQDTVVIIQDLKQWLDIGVVKNGKTPIKIFGEAKNLSYLMVNIRYKIWKN